MSTILEVNQVNKHFGKFHTLKNVSFKVNRGEVVGFIGPNGAGKSTTIRILLGTIKRDNGTATIFGQDVWRDSFDIHKRISYVPGDVTLFGNLTGGEVIDLFMKLHGSGSKERRDELVERFNLDLKKKCKSYSKGNRQKVGLISALAVDSDLYIFDEPTSGLDPLMERIFQEEVTKLKDAGKAVLLSSHILSEVEQLADKVIIIREGEIVEQGTLESLRHLTRSNVKIETKHDVSQLKILEGVHDFKQDENHATFSIDPLHLNQLLTEATKLNVKTLQVTPPTLEDLFIEHY